MKHVVVLGAQVPFSRGGAELLNESLVYQINQLKDVRAELVQLPYKWFPEDQILNDIIAWRMLDLTYAGDKKVDLVIGTKFPSYTLNHPNKVLWLVHQHRTLYDLAGSEYDVHYNDAALRKKICAIDTQTIQECKAKYTISSNVSQRLKKYNNIDSTPLLPPSPYQNDVEEGDYKDYILYVGRLDVLKRVELMIEGLAYTKTLKAIIIGRGSDSYTTNLENIIKQYNLEDRCKLLGFLDDNSMLEYLKHARAVFYAPVDEDYGYFTIEGFLAKKPIITCTDSGEVYLNVVQTGAGFVCKPDKEDIGKKLEIIEKMSTEELKNLAISGFEFAKKLSWQTIIQKLVIEHL